MKAVSMTVPFNYNVYKKLFNDRLQGKKELDHSVFNGGIFDLFSLFSIQYRISNL